MNNALNDQVIKLNSLCVACFEALRSPARTEAWGQVGGESPCHVAEVLAVQEHLLSLFAAVDAEDQTLAVEHRSQEGPDLTPLPRAHHVLLGT